MNTRGRPPGPDRKKILIILKVLAEAPEGLWIREIARRSRLNPMTVSNYANTALRPFLEDISLGDEKPILRVLRLKKWALEKIRSGATLSEIMRWSEIIRRVGKK